MIVDHVDEGESISIEAEMANPLLKVMVLFFDFLDETCKQVLHFFLHHEHLRDLSVRILANDVL